MLHHFFIDKAEELDLVLLGEAHADDVDFLFLVFEEPHIHDAAFSVKEGNHSLSYVINDVGIFEGPMVFLEFLLLIFLSSNTRAVFVNDLAAEITRCLILYFLSLNRNPIDGNLLIKTGRLFN